MAWRSVAVVAVLLLTACAPLEAPTPTAVPTVPAPTSTPTPARPEDVAAGFFESWQHGQYGRMYDALSAQAQAATPRELFIRRYANIHDGIGETRLSIQTAGTTQPAPAGLQVPFQVTRSVAL